MPPSFVTTYDPESLPPLNGCYTHLGNQTQAITVPIDEQEIRLRPGDVVQTTNSLGGTDRYFIRGRNGHIITHELTKDHHYLFRERDFGRMADSAVDVAIYRNPWNLPTDATH